MARKWKSSETSRLRIIEAAAETFGQKGYYGTTIREISEACGLSLPSLYHHFEDKEHIFVACLDHVHLSLRQAMQTDLTTDQSLVTELQSLFWGIQRFRQEHPLYIYLLFSLTYAAPEHIQKEYGERYKSDFRDTVTAAFRRHRPTGKVRVKMTLVIALLNNYLLDITAPVENSKLHASTLAAIEYALR